MVGDLDGDGGGVGTLRVRVSRAHGHARPATLVGGNIERISTLGTYAGVAKVGEVMHAVYARAASRRTHRPPHSALTMPQAEDHHECRGDEDQR